MRRGNQASATERGRHAGRFRFTPGTPNTGSYPPGYTAGCPNRKSQCSKCRVAIPRRNKDHSGHWEARPRQLLVASSLPFESKSDKSGNDLLPTLNAETANPTSQRCPCRSVNR